MAAVVGLAVLRFVALPLWRRAEEGVARVEAVKQRVAKARAWAEAAGAVDEALAAARTAYGDLRGRLASADSPEDARIWLQRAVRQWAEDAGVSVGRVEVVLAEHEGLWRVSASVSGQAALPRCMAFLANAERARPGGRVETLVLRPGAGEGVVRFSAGIVAWAGNPGGEP